MWITCARIFQQNQADPDKIPAFEPPTVNIFKKTKVMRNPRKLENIVRMIEGATRNGVIPVVVVPYRT